MKDESTCKWLWLLHPIRLARAIAADWRFFGAEGRRTARESEEKLRDWNDGEL